MKLLEKNANFSKMPNLQDLDLSTPSFPSPLLKPEPMLCKMFSMVLMASIYSTTGILHLLYPEVYMKIMPDFLPYPYELVILSGLAELAGGLGLLLP
jgi:hypothetical protein